MRLFAEEKKLGTSELLFTFPLRDGEILLGKFTACLFIYVLMLALTFLYPLLLCSVWDLEIAPILSGYLGILLIGCAFISLGIFVSSFTENQIVAAMVTFAILLFLGIIAFNAGKTNAVMERILIHLSFLEHLDAFAKGVINTKSIIYCLNFTFFFLFLTLQSLKSNRWRGLK